MKYDVSTLPVGPCPLCYSITRFLEIPKNLLQKVLEWGVGQRPTIPPAPYTTNI